MRHNLNLNPHIVLSQPRNPNASPQWLMPRHPLLESPNHSLQCLIINWYMVRVHAVHLLPAFSASGFQCQINIFEGLVDLSVYFAGEDARGGVPAAWSFSSVSYGCFSDGDSERVIPCPEHSILSPTRTAWLYLNFCWLVLPTPS